MSTTVAGLDFMVRRGLEPWQYDKEGGLMYFRDHPSSRPWQVTYGVSHGPAWAILHLDASLDEQEWAREMALYNLRKKVEWQTTRSRT